MGAASTATMTMPTTRATIPTNISPADSHSRVSLGPGPATRATRAANHLRRAVSMSLPFSGSAYGIEVRLTLVGPDVSVGLIPEIRTWVSHCVHLNMSL